MDCRKSKKLVDLYLDGEADSSQTQMLLSHVDECRKCRVRLEEIRDLHNTIKSVSAIELPLGFRSSVIEGVRATASRPIRRSIIFHPGAIWGSIAVVAFLALIITWGMYNADKVPPVALEAPEVPETRIVLPRAVPIINAHNDSPKPEGTAIVVTVSQDEPEISDTFTYSFDWNNDGNYDIVDQANPWASHIWNDNGVYTVGIGAKNKDDDIHTTATSVKVTDLVPTAGFTWTPGSQDEGSEILFVDASTSSLDAIERWSWDFGDAAGMSAERSPSYTYGDNGVYKVTLTVTDDDGSSTSETMTLTVNNVAPSVLAGADQIVDEGASVSLVSAVFADPGAGDTHTAIIDWGDNTVEAGIVNESPSEPSDSTITGEHIYADNGVYEVAITVTDDDGASASDTLTMTVNNVAPLVLAGADQVVDEGTPVSLDSTIFIDPGNHDTHTAIIDWGDSAIESGTVSETPSGPSASIVGANGTVINKHVYGDNGIYKVTITVTDDDGASASNMLTVTVNNVAPSMAAGVDQIVNEGEPVSLTSSTFSDPGALDTHTAVIKWGDGAVQNGMLDEASSEPSGSILGSNGTVLGKHVYAQNGSYTVTLEVEDDDGAFNSDTLTVTVNNQPPSVGPISMSVSGAEEQAPVVEVNTIIEPSASFRDAGVSDTHTTEWNWGDGNTLAGVVDADGVGSISGKHVYHTPGVYAVTLRVTDDDGDWDESVFDYVVVYDPNDKFIAGNGWVDSPLKAYTANPEFSGKASFGFMSRYEKGEDIPSGNTELRFRMADMDFRSRECQWLVATGPNVQFRGRGTINGSGDYKFILAAIDGSISGDGGVDGFRIKIWEEQTIQGVVQDLIVYDNLLDDNTDLLLSNVTLKQKEETGLPRTILGYAMVVLLVTQVSVGISMALQYLMR